MTKATAKSDPKPATGIPGIRYERRKLADLVLDKRNPRVMRERAKQALGASIRRFGLVQPIVLNETTGHVVGGHQRISVLKEQGVDEVDVAVGTWTAEEERALNVALNNPDAQGEFDGSLQDFLSDSLRALSIKDFQELRFDELLLSQRNGGRQEKKGPTNRVLEYKLVVSCLDESHQAELLEELEQRGLAVKLLIV